MENQKSLFQKVFDKFSLKSKIIIAVVIFIVIIAIILSIGLSIENFNREHRKADIYIKASLEKIVNVSELSSYEVKYEGIAKVVNEKNSDKVDFYVAYEAVVKAGVDIEKINMSLDKKENIVYIELPDVIITSSDIDENTLDFMFIKNKYNDETALPRAISACNADIKTEINSKDVLKKLAEENAKNIVKAFISPFLEQLDEEYSIEFI